MRWKITAYQPHKHGEDFNKDPEHSGYVSTPDQVEITVKVLLQNGYRVIRIEDTQKPL